MDNALFKSDLWQQNTISKKHGKCLKNFVSKLKLCIFAKDTISKNK